MVGDLTGRNDPFCDYEYQKVVLPVYMSDSGTAHLFKFRMSPETVCGMLKDTIECPKKKKGKTGGKPFRKTTMQVCSRRDRKIFSILLDRDNVNGASVLRITHLEPIT